MGNIIVPCSGYSPEAKMFLESAKAGDQGRVVALLTQNPELLTCRKGLSEQTTPWHMLAARSGALATLKTLVGFALSERSPFGDLPLAQRQERLRALLDSENVRGQTVMLVACNQGHGEVVAYLVQQGADPFHGDRAGSTGLHLAGFKGGCFLIMDATAKREAQTTLGWPRQGVDCKRLGIL